MVFIYNKALFSRLKSWLFSSSAIAVLLFGMHALYYRFASGSLLPIQPPYLASQIIVVSCFSLTIYFLPIGDLSKSTLLILWLAKALFTLTFVQYYEDSYANRLDANLYYENAVAADNTKMDAAFEATGTRAVVSISRAAFAFLPQSMPSLRLFFSFIGLLGLWLLAKSAALLSNRNEFKAILLFFLCPGILFWSSTIGKESLAIFVAAVHAYGCALIFRDNKNVAGYFWAIAGIFGAHFVRPWHAIILGAPFLVILYCTLQNALRRRMTIVATQLVLIPIMFLSASTVFVLGKGYFPKSVLATANRLAASFKIGGSQTDSPRFFSSIDQVIAYFPMGAFTAIFRPLPGEVLSFFGTCAGIESLFLLAVFMIFCLKIRVKQLWDIKMIWILCIMVTWVCMYAFVSPHNLGTGIRYRIQVIPFLLFGLFLVDLTCFEAPLLRFKRLRGKTV